MGKNTKIICSVVPNGVHENGNLKFSVFLSPRLPDSGRLKEYYEVLHWDEFINFFKLNSKLKVILARIVPDESNNYYFEKQEVNGVSIIKVFDLPIQFDRTELTKIVNHLGPPKKNKTPASILTLENKLQKKLWSRLFNPQTPVRGWILDEGKYEQRTEFLYGKTAGEYEPYHGPIENSSVNLSSEGAGTTTQNRRQPDQGESVREAAQEDINSNVMMEEEIRLRNKENQEFHKKLSVLADYPHLLRATGWVLDYEIDLQKNIINLNEYNVIKVNGFEFFPGFEVELTDKDKRKWGNFINEIDFKTPWTYYEADLSAKVFTYGYADKYKKDYFAIKDGYIIPTGPLNEQNKKYKVLASQYQRNQSLEYLKKNLQVFNPVVSQNINSRNYPELMNLVDSNKRNDDVSEGIVLKIVGIHPAETQMINQPGSDVIIEKEGKDNIIIVEDDDNSANNINNYILFGHHLDVGYVIEVAKGNKGDYKSLTKRIADYSVDVSEFSGKRKYKKLFNKFYDEGWISEVAVAGKTGKLYINEEICRWNNWSLICPQIGNHPQDEKVKDEHWIYNDLELRNIRPVPGSLTPLRFGENYNFRIKVVDICGNRTNKPAPEEANIPLTVDDKTPIIYKRLEPVNGPELYFVKNVFQNSLCRKLHNLFTPDEKDITLIIKDEYIGEQTNVIVIRSSGGNATESKLIQDIIPERSLSPARINFHFAELHGVLDDYQNLPAVSLNGPSNLDEYVEYLRKLEKREKVYKRAAYESDVNVEAFEINQIIPFLTDPVVSGFYFKLIVKPSGEHNTFPEGFDFFIGSKSCVIDISARDYLSKKFAGVKLLANSSGNKIEALSPNPNVTLVHLQPTTIAELLVGVSKEQLSVNYLGIFEEDIFERFPDKYTKIMVIHAVKKPYLFGNAPSTITLKLKDRDPFTKTTFVGDALVNFNIENYFYYDETESPKENFPFGSSSEVSLKMVYKELIIDILNPNGFKLEDRIKYKEYSNLTNIIEGELMPKLKYGGEIINGFINVVQSGLGFIHSFADSKYRKVSYSFEGHSRFKQFFPDLTAENDLNEYVYKQELGVRIVKSSKKPKAPVIHSIVPLLRWNKDQFQSRIINNTNKWVERINDTFRIYFEGDWYDSGADEKAAVIFYLDKSGTIPDEIGDLVSSFGRDSASLSRNTQGLQDLIFDKDGLGNKVQIIYDLNYKLLNLDPETDDELYVGGKERPSGSHVLIGTTEVPSLKGKIKAAIFPVQFDPDPLKQLFYVDIKLDFSQFEKGIYMPFLKFAISRFQENSIESKGKYDFRFSKVVLAPQVQVLPDRRLEWNMMDYTIKKLESVSPRLNIKLLGQRRNNGKRNNSSLIVNEYYIIAESQFIKDSISINYSKADPNFPFTRAFRLHEEEDSFSFIDKLVPVEILDLADSICFEEYEVYNAIGRNGDSFEMDESESNYCPRNDIRKRLVFSYRIIQKNR